jgi:hypothetical protein
LHYDIPILSRSLGVPGDTQGSAGDLSYGVILVI